MSKKVNATEAATTATTNFNLKEAMTAYPNVSLRKLATACELSYGWVLKQAKKPIPGETYDPEAINYEAVQATFVKKGIDLSTLAWDALNEAVVKRGSLLTKDMSAFEVGAKVYLREDNTTPFVVCYKTETHIVIMKEGSTEPRAWSHATFLMKGPVFEPRTKGTDVAEESEEA